MKNKNLPAPSITLGLLVLVQLVIAAITTEPCLSLYSFPSNSKVAAIFSFSKDKPKPLNPTYKRIMEISALKEHLSLGFNYP